MQGLRSGSKAVAAVSFLTPGLGLLALFVVVPILLTAWISLHRGSMAVPYSQLEWVGLHNYAILFQQATFRTALVNVFLYSLTNLIIILPLDRKSTRLNSSHLVISYAVFCLKK